MPWFGVPQYRTNRVRMDDAASTAHPNEFGSFQNYLAAWVEGLRAARETSRTETTGRFAKTEKDEDGSEEFFTTGKNPVNLSTGSLRGI